MENGAPLKSFLSKNLLTVALSIAAALGAYYTTVSALQVSLATKADSSYMMNMEKRLSVVENNLERSFITRDDFYRFREEISYRLSKIEFKLGTLVEGENNADKR